MALVFPNLPKLSLWDIACGHTGQNAADLLPTNETRHKLAELVKDASEHMLWVEFARAGDDSGLFIEFMPAAPRAAVDADWRRLNDVTVRREDWERYEKHRMQAEPDAVMPADIEQVGSTLAKPLAPHVSKLVELIANDEPIDWDYWAGKMPRWTANQAVRLMSALDPLKHRDLSFTRNETGGAAKEHATRMEMLAASHGMTEASPLEWLGWADGLSEPVHEGCRRAVTFAAKQAHTLKLVQEQADLWAHRLPARLYGDGFSEEMQKQTTLTRYLQYDTWTPEAAAMLVCGLQAPIIDGQLCTEIPGKGAMGLDNCFIAGSQDPFHEAKRVLGIWRSQENPPAKVRPFDFIRWCQARGFDTTWLRSIEEDAFNGERQDMKAALGSGVVVIPSAPLLSAEWLAGHIAFSLVSIPDDERLATVFKETVVKRQLGLTQSKREALTSDDQRLVRSICGNPPVPCSRAQFDEWRGKFDAARNRPVWSLVGEFRASDEMANAQARWSDVSIAHKQQIARRVDAGDLSLVTADGVETVDATKGFIRRDDVKRYLDHYNLPWRDAQAKAKDADTSRSANGQPKALKHGTSPDARELSTIGLTSEQWDRMTGAQRQSASQAIADTMTNSKRVARQSADRRALGRYTLNEAARAIAATGERHEPLQEKLCCAALHGDLPMHAPGELARYLYENGRLVRPFYEEAYWNDLNAWLEKCEPRITFRFARPDTSGTVATQETVVAIPSPDGLATREEDQATHSGPRSFTKHAIGTRSNPLKAIIEKAKSSAADPSDIHSVWAALVKLAQDTNRPAPLLGYADAEGVKWDANGTVKFFTKRNLADRLRRANTR